jgi:transcriptional regulator GlxA family with amidase domain
MKKIAVILFNNFETLDVYGPVEIFGRLSELYKIRFYSFNGGLISNHHGVSVETEKLEELAHKTDIFLIPGGIGTRKEVENKVLISEMKRLCDQSEYVLTVCTGSALLAKTGLLDGRMATSNKRAFKWASSNGPNVNWIKHARWVVDGKFYTSSGVSAGMDMSLGFLADRHGIGFARNVAEEIEYNWQEDKNSDEFSGLCS